MLRTRKKASYAQSDLILQFLVNRVANLLVLHICGVHLERVSKTNRDKIIDATSTKIFVRFMMTPNFGYEEGASLADGLFRTIRDSELDLTKDIEDWLEADAKGRQEIVKNRNIVKRKNEQMKFLTKVHKLMSKEIYTNFNRVMGTLRKNDIRVISGLPADEYILSKVLDSVTRGSYDISEIMADEYVASQSVMSADIKETILKKYRYKGKDNIFGVVYTFYNNKRIGKSKKFTTKIALFNKMVDDAKYFNGKIKIYATSSLSRYIDNQYVNEEVMQIADTEESYNNIETQKTDALLDLIDSERDSASLVKNFYAENKETLEEDYAYADFDTRKEILQARQGLLNNVIKGLKHADLSKESLQYTVKNILSDPERHLGGIDPYAKSVLERQLDYLEKYDWDNWDASELSAFDPDNLDESQLTEDISFEALLETLQEVFITQPNADPLITELMNNLKTVQTWDEKNKENLKDQIGSLKKMLEEHSNILGKDYDYLKQAILKRRVKSGDLDADEFLDLNEEDRYEYINAIENNFVRDFGEYETSLYNYVLDTVGGNLDQFGKFASLYKSGKGQDQFNAVVSKVALKISSKEIKVVNKRNHLSKMSLTFLANKEAWNKKYDNVPMDKACTPPADTIKEMIEEVNPNLPQNLVNAQVKKILENKSNIPTLFFNGKISSGDNQKKIEKALKGEEIPSLKNWYRNRLDLLDKIKKKFIEENSKAITSKEEAFNEDSEKALTDALGGDVSSLLERLEVSVLENMINSLSLKQKDKEVLRGHLEKALKGRALWYASSQVDREKYQISERAVYEEKKEELEQKREETLSKFVKLLKNSKLITNLNEEYLEEIITGYEELPAQPSDLKDQKYANIQKALLEHRSYLYKGTSDLAKEVRSLSATVRNKLKFIEGKYKDEKEEEIQIEVGAKDFQKKKEGIAKHLKSLVDLHLKDEDLTWKEKRKKQYFRSQTIRKSLMGAIEHSITDDYGQSITQILKKLNIYDMSHENLMEIVDDQGLAECFPSAQPLQDDNFKRLIKVYFLSVEKGLEVFFNKSTRQYQSSSLKFPNDFLSADLGSKLFEQFLLGIRGKYSWQFRDHLEKWGQDMESEDIIDPTGLGFDFENQIWEANSDQSSTGFIPPSFWDKVGLSDIPEILENVEGEGAISISDDGSHLIHFVDPFEEEFKLSYDPKKLEKELKENRILAFARDFGVDKKYATIVLNEVMRSSVGLSQEKRTNILNFLRGACFDLTYLASAWALELLQNQKTLVDTDFSIECFEFMDQLSTLAQKEEAQQILIQKLKEEAKRNNKRFKTNLDPEALGDLV